MAADLKDAKVNAETDLNPKKTRKARTAKPKPSNYDQALAMAQGLNMEDKANLIKELKRQLLSDSEKLIVQANEAQAILKGI